MDRIRVEGGGRPTVKKTPEIVDDLKEVIIEESTAGDPMQKACKWVRFSLRKLCLEMENLGHNISPMTH